MQHRAMLALWGIAGALPAMAAGGCGTSEIDSGSAATAVKGAITKPLSGVTCPSGVEAKSGKTFNCTATLADGSKYTVPVDVQGTNGGKAQLLVRAQDATPTK